MVSSGSYSKLKDLAKDNGGSMEWNKHSKCWEITINGKMIEYSSFDGGYIPELDKLYIPMVVEPKEYADHKDELLDDARVHFLRPFGL